MFAKRLAAAAAVIAFLLTGLSANHAEARFPELTAAHSPLAALPVFIDLDGRLPLPPVLYLYRGQSLTFVHGPGTRVTITPPWGLVVGGRVGNSYVYRAVNPGSGMFLINIQGGPGHQGTRIISIRVR